MFRANRTRQSEQHREQVLLPNAAVVYALMQHVEETFEYLRSEDRLSLPSKNVMVALASVGQLLGLAEGDIERLLNFTQKEPSFALTGMSYSEFVDAVRCLAVLHGHLALEAIPVLQVPDLSKALYNTYMSYSQALRPHASGAMCRCRQVAGEPPPRLFWESFLRLARDAGFVHADGPLPLPTLERIWLGSSSVCDRHLPEHMCFAQFLRSLAVVAGQIQAEVFVPVAALGLAHEVPLLKPVPNSYRLKYYKEVPLNLGGNWSLPHLTFEALAKAVQEGRQYEYPQFLADAQETASRDENQRRQFRYGSGALSTVDSVDSGGGGAGCFSARMNSMSPKRAGSACSSVGGGGGSAAANARVRPWSAGLTVLSPHPRRPGRSGASTSGSVAMSGTPSGVSPGRDPGEGFLPNMSPPAISLAAAAAGTPSSTGGGANATRQGAAAPVLSNWLTEEPSAATLPPHGSTAPGMLLPSPTLSPNSRALERSRSAMNEPAAASHSAYDRDRDSRVTGNGSHPGLPHHGGGGGGANRGPQVPLLAPPGLLGVEGGGRVCLDSARPRALHSTSFSASTSPRVSLLSMPPGSQGPPGPLGPSSPAPGPPSAPTMGRVLSRRSYTNVEGPPVMVCACCGGGGGGGSASGLVASSARCGNVEAVESSAGGLREVRRDLEARLGALEEHERGVMQMLAQLQAQVAALQQHHQQQHHQQQQPPPAGSEPSLQVDTGTAVAEATSSYTVTSDPGGSPLLRDDIIQREQQQQQQQPELHEGPATGSRLPFSPPSRSLSRSPSRPSSAIWSPEGRVDTARYGVVVKTSDLRGAGTDADVLLTIYGTKGDTGERLLSNGTYNFERGQVSTFVFTAADVGEVERLRVRMRTQGTAGSAPSWHLDAIQVASSATGTRYRFPHCGWVDNVLGCECVLYCKGTAPDTDGDPPGWQPTPPRSSVQYIKAQPQSPSQQQQQQHQAPLSPMENHGLPLSPSPALTPRPVEAGRSSPSSPPQPPISSQLPDTSAPPGAALPNGDTTASGQDPPGGGAMGMTTASLPPADGRSGDVNSGAEDSLSLMSEGDTLPGGDKGTAGILMQLQGSVAELQQRLLQVEEGQAEYAMRAAAATAGAVLVRVPAQLLAEVRYGRKAPGDAAAGDVMLHRRSSGAGGAMATAADGGRSNSDSALMLLADLLTHLHTLAEQGVAAAAVADTQAAGAVEATRRQQRQLTQLQFELTATSRAAEHAAKRYEEITRRLEAAAAAAAPLQLPPPPPTQLADQNTDGDVPRPQTEGGPEGFDRDSQLGGLMEELLQCKSRLSSLTTDVKRLAAEQGGGRAAAAAAAVKVEVLLTETRAFHSRLAVSIADVAASLASQRQAQDPGSGAESAVRLAQAAAADGSIPLQDAMDALHLELLQLAKMVAGRRGRRRARSSEGHGGGAVRGVSSEGGGLADSGAVEDDDDSVPSRSSSASTPSMH